jgi:tripartite-type tricarboxylate transporter receptor subunit TctC
MPIHWRSYFIALNVGLAVCTSAAAAQQGAEYPNRPIRAIVPFVAGASYDTIMRIIAEPLGESFRQPVVIENRPGASAMIGADLIAKGSPDGHTIGMLGDNHTILAAVGRETPYDLFTDFAPITRVASLDNVIVVHPAIPAKSVKELIGLLKANPGKYRYGSGGTAGSTHLAGARFAQFAGVDILHVPYKGGGLAVTGLVGGEVHMMIVNMISARPHVQGGRMRALVVAARERSPHLPDVPTAAEAGLPGYEVSQFYAIVAPAKTPKAIVERISSELKAIVSSEGVRRRLNAQGADTHFESPGELLAFLRQEVNTHRETAQRAGIKVGN